MVPIQSILQVVSSTATAVASQDITSQAGKSFAHDLISVKYAHVGISF